MGCITLKNLGHPKALHRWFSPGELAAKALVEEGTHYFFVRYIYIGHEDHIETTYSLYPMCTLYHYHNNQLCCILEVSLSQLHKDYIFVTTKREELVWVS